MELSTSPALRRLNIVLMVSTCHALVEAVHQQYLGLYLKSSSMHIEQNTTLHQASRHNEPP